MSTLVHLNLLDQVKIASPCSVPWESMVGDDKTRHCSQCNLNVYNLSAMTRDEAETLLLGKGEGRMCGAFFRRADGTILTRDCPVGIAAVRARVRRAAGRVAAVLGFAVTGVVVGGATQETWGWRARLRAVQPFERLCAWLAPNAPPPYQTMVAGEMCFPTPPPPAPPQGNQGTTPAPRTN